MLSGGVGDQDQEEEEGAARVDAGEVAPSAGTESTRGFAPALIAEREAAE
jgi:hypothetical protein